MSDVDSTKKICNLLCGKRLDKECFNCQNSTHITVFEQLDWNFERLFDARSQFNCPCRPISKCQCNLKKNKKKNKKNR